MFIIIVFDYVFNTLFSRFICTPKESVKGSDSLLEIYFLNVLPFACASSFVCYYFDYVTIGPRGL